MVSLRYFFVSLLILLSSCSTPPLAPVVEKSILTNRQEVEPMGGELIRIIQPGDTLYSIAFALGLDVNELAAWNGLSDKSRIFAGQRLRLTKPIGFRTQAIAAQTKKFDQDKRVSTASKANQPTLSKQAILSQKPSEASTAKLATKPITKQALVKKRISNANVSWSWPITGHVISGFNPSSGKQGVDIRGEQGQSVYSAALGDVVYVGNGLKGYGNLVIIKHSTHYLSAYAHNQQVFVAEGDQVAARQKIAAVGKNGSNGYLLHFQIRQDGKPVNPMNYLPKKS